MRVSVSGSVKSAAFIIALWTLYAVNQTIHSYYQFQLWGKPIPFWRAVWGEFSFAYLCAAFTPAVLYIGSRFRVARPHVWRNLAVQCTAAVIFMSIVRLGWDLLYQPPKAFFSGGVTLQKAIFSISSTYEATLSAYLLIILAGYAHDYQRRYRKEAVRASRLQTEIVQAQLQALKMQLQPHFLFNTLHTISALVQQSPAAAERMIARLSDLLRLTLDIGRMTEIRFEEELRICELYLEIEQTRYEERLNVRYDIDDAVREALVPSFILQPLVENAVVHGISQSVGPGLVEISAEQKNGELILKVRNTGPGLSRLSLREGVGIGATRSRLEFLYGQKQRFELRDLTTGVVEASIALPFSTGSRRGDYGDDPSADRGRREVGARASAPALGA
jgi:two-component system LytT family sensor kinase